MAEIMSTLEAAANMSKRSFLTPNIQLFAHSGGDGEDNGGDDGADDKGGEGGDNTDPADKGGKGDDKDKGSEKLQQYIQSAIDKALAKERKAHAETKKALEALQKEKLTDDELAEVERKRHDKEIADRERAVVDKENRFIAIKAIKDAGLDDGSDKALALVDLVVTGHEDTEETITAKVKAVQALITSMVAAKVEERFKGNGRNPNGSGDDDGDDDKKGKTIAAKLGKQRAEQDKKANDVLAHYGIGGK